MASLPPALVRIVDGGTSRGRGLFQRGFDGANGFEAEELRFGDVLEPRAFEHWDGGKGLRRPVQLIMQLARARDGRVLFLVDELLAGTNSRDRQTGGAAILQGLVARGAIGLATTHDLALAAVTDTDALRGKARNVHFQDVIEGDRVVFDYRLRDGVVERSNALALMRAVGLDV